MLPEGFPFRLFNWTKYPHIDSVISCLADEINTATKHCCKVWSFLYCNLKYLAFDNTCVGTRMWEVSICVEWNLSCRVYEKNRMYLRRVQSTLSSSYIILQIKYCHVIHKYTETDRQIITNQRVISETCARMKKRDHIIYEH